MKSAQEKPELLVVEDSLTQAERLRYSLEQLGYRVTLADNGQQAMACLQASRPALVVSDINMPEMNGYELCREIKETPELRDLPVILLTSLADVEDVLKGLTCGADGFITKPYSDEHLFAHIARTLAEWSPARARQNIEVEIVVDGKPRTITTDARQMLGLLLSTYESALYHNTALIHKQDELNALNEHLEDVVEQRTAALSAEIAERAQAEEEVRQLNAELEKRVQARTAQLEAANKELEAFAYSVSHDLRAPLRSIDGWSMVLLEDYGEQLDAQGRGYLDRVRSEAQRMGRLIDALLQLSRLTRADLEPDTVDLSALAETVAARLQAEQPARQFEFNIQPGVMARGDAHLLEIALTNLLGNAAKFTGTRSIAQIEFGLTPDADQPAYFVRDNGVGFDPAHAQNLFGAFQRLHSAAKFPGTGIGLATVQRIIHRHGGEIWAEAQVDQGATFYFTLE